MNNITIHQKYKGHVITLSSDIHVVKECFDKSEPVILLITNENRFLDTMFIRYAFEIEEYNPDLYDENGNYVGPECDISEEEVMKMFSDTDAERVIARSLGLPVVITETDRIIVRELSVNDIEELKDFFIYERPENIDKIFDSTEEIKEYIARYSEEVYDFYGFGIWGIFVKEMTGLKFAGTAGFTARKPNELFLNEKCDDNSFSNESIMDLELGFALLKKYRKQGIAYEACKTIIEFAKKNIEYNMIFVNIAPSNEPAVKLAKKLRICGELEIRLYDGGYSCFWSD